LQRVAVVIIFTSIAFYVPAQTSQFGFTLGPNLGSRDLDKTSDYWDRDVQPGLGLNLAVFKVFGGRKKWSFDLGINYTNTVISREAKFRTFGDAATPRSTIAYSTQDDFDRYEARSTFGHLGLFGKLNFSTQGEGLRLIAGIGVNPEIMILNREKIDFLDGDDLIRTSSVKYESGEFNITAIASIGCAFDLTSDLQMRIEPVFRYSILKTTEFRKLYRLWSSGLNCSIVKLF
jgi:hypothetical protein